MKIILVLTLFGLTVFWFHYDAQKKRKLKKDKELKGLNKKSKKALIKKIKAQHDKMVNNEKKLLKMQRERESKERQTSEDNRVSKARKRFGVKTLDDELDAKPSPTTSSDKGGTGGPLKRGGF